MTLTSIVAASGSQAPDEREDSSSAEPENKSQATLINTQKKIIKKQIHGEHALAGVRSGTSGTDHPISRSPYPAGWR